MTVVISIAESTHSPTRVPAAVISRRCAIFIWEHWQKKRRGYIRVTVDSVDTMSTSHIFVEPNDRGPWHVAWRVAQARGNAPSVVRDLSPFTTVERVDSKLAFKATDGSETHL